MKIGFINVPSVFLVHINSTFVYYVFMWRILKPKKFSSLTKISNGFGWIADHLMAHFLGGSSHFVSLINVVK